MPAHKRSPNIYDEASLALFWAKVDRSDIDGCWVWTGAKNGRGYGLLNRANKLVLVHRFSYRAAFGEFDDNMFVCHRCDNPPCVNPAHLFLGTNTDNMRDCSKKGRVVIPHVYGERVNGAKINPGIVREIRSLRAKGFTEQRVADMLGITKRIVNCVSSGKTWKHVE